MLSSLKSSQCFYLGVAFSSEPAQRLDRSAHPLPIVFLAARGNALIVERQGSMLSREDAGRAENAVTIVALRRCPKIEQRAGRVVIELAGLGPIRRAHRQDEFRGLIRRVERQRVFAGK